MLTFIKLLHTVVWAFFVACILAIFVFAQREQFGAALITSAVVLGEVLVLVVNRMKCPLTSAAERYTDERAANFDIYLPLWLAQHNQTVFGSLYAIGLAYTLASWLLT